MGQILYFLFYPSSGTAGCMPRPCPVRVRRHGPPRGFNVTTRSKGLPRSTSNSPSGLDSTSAVAYLMEGPTTRMDCSRAIHPTGQPNPHISPLYGTLGPTGPIHPTSWVTSNGTGHTLRIESTRGLGQPIEWVAPWVRPVPMKSLNTPRSVHVASYEELHGIDHATWSLMLPLWPLVPCNPTVPIPLMRPLVFFTL